MKKFSILATASSAASTVALSFALMACGDDSSSTAPISGGDESSSSTQISSSAGDVESSSSVDPGSSANVENSSSSVAGNPVQKVKVGGKCMTSSGNGNTSMPGGDGLALPPHAAMGLEDGSAVIFVDHVMMPTYKISGFTGMIVNPALLDSVEVMAVGDTLYVKQIVDESLTQEGSKCVAEFYFTMKADPAFTNTSFIVVDDYLRSPIDKESYAKSSSSVASSSSVVSRSVAVPVSNVSLACMPNHYFDGNTMPDGILAEPYPNLGQITRIDGFAKLSIINTYLNLPCSGDSAVVNAAVNEAKIAIARSGANLIDDTLFVNIDRNKGEEYTCGCNAKVDFLFDGQYADFGYTVFDNNEPTEVLDAAKDRPHQKIENVDAKCSTRGNSDDPLVDGGSNDMALPPVAYMYDLGNYAQIVIETVQLTCGTQFKYIDVSVGGDTLYVKPVVDESSLQADCICSTMLDFKIDMDEDFWNASLLVFDYGWGYNPSNKMHIVKQRNVIEAPI